MDSYGLCLFGKIIILDGHNYYNGEGSKPSGDENQLHLIKYEETLDFI